MAKAYFNQGFLDFFIELAAHNHKDWFDENRARYIRDVKNPFAEFITALIEKLKKVEELGDIDASDCIFRINRDIRFSKDKTPYKHQMSAAISKGGKKDMINPGLYIELGPEHLAIYTGMYMPDKELLHQVRLTIATNLKKFETIINQKDFKKVFEDVKGEKSKILPSELKEKAKEQALIFNKQFYLVHSTDPEIILDEKLLDYIVKNYQVAAAFNDFLKSAI